MAGTATAKKRGTKPLKGFQEVVKEPSPKPKKPRKVAGARATPSAQLSLVAKVEAEHPGITSHQFVERYNVPLDEAYRMDWFCTLYLHDFNATNAALVMGYHPDNAKQTGQLFLTHVFCQLRIRETLQNMGADKIVTAQQVIARLWQEANAPDVAFSSNATSRISALTQLAKILQLGTPKKEEKQQGFAGGVMMIPIAVSQEEWGEFARQSQNHLVESSTIDV